MAGGLEEFVRRLNIQRYRALLLIERDESRRQMIRSLLEAEEAAARGEAPTQESDSERRGS